MDASDDTTLRSRLQGLRKQQRDENGKSLTQEVLAKALGIPYNTYSNWEREVAQPNADNLRQLANYFGVSTDYLLGLTDDPSPRPPPRGDPERHEAT